MRFMKNVDLPKELQQKVLHYYDFIWTTHRGFASEELLSNLPSRLKHDCVYYRFQHLAKKASDYYISKCVHCHLISTLFVQDRALSLVPVYISSSLNCELRLNF
jgi:hypothetical protein